MHAIFEQDLMLRRLSKPLVQIVVSYCVGTPTATQVDSVLSCTSMDNVWSSLSRTVPTSHSLVFITLRTTGADAVNICALPFVTAVDTVSETVSPSGAVGWIGPVGMMGTGLTGATGVTGPIGMEGSTGGMEGPTRPSGH
jgi:hypothetical protein